MRFKIYIPSSSSGLVALAVHTAPVRRTRPHLTKRCRPFLLRRSVILILMRCSTRRLEELCNTSMNHLMTYGTLLTSLCRARTRRQSSLLRAGQNSTSLPRRKLWMCLAEKHITTGNVIGVGILTSASDLCAASTGGRSDAKTCTAVVQCQPDLPLRIDNERRNVQS